MKNASFLLIWISIFLLAGCNGPKPEKEAAQPDEQTVVDTVSSEQPKAAHSRPLSMTKDSMPMTENTAEVAAGRLAGEHSLTLQWISWTKPGTITFRTIGEHKYEVEGLQQGVEGDECPQCYLSVKGTITEVTPRKLSFTGKIVSSVHHIQNGEPCVKEGTFDFVASGNRKYWRCQNQQGCEGVTNYVDIYF